jgi:hypothetical protein
MRTGNNWKLAACIAVLALSVNRLERNAFAQSRAHVASVLKAAERVHRKAKEISKSKNSLHHAVRRESTLECQSQLPLERARRTLS